MNKKDFIQHLQQLNELSYQRGTGSGPLDNAISRLERYAKEGVSRVIRAGSPDPKPSKPKSRPESSGEVGKPRGTKGKKKPGSNN